MSNTNTGNWTIYKYPIPMTRESGLEDDGAFTIGMPHGSRILSVANQYETPVLWAIVDKDMVSMEDKECRRFLVCGTGLPLGRDPRDLTFLGTIILMGGSLVVHVFEIQ